MLVKQCVQKIKHDIPSCKSTTGKSLQVWLNEKDDGTKFFSGYCFACCLPVADPYGNNPPDPAAIKIKTPEEIQEEIDEIRECPPFDLTHRSIDPEYWKKYGVRKIFSEFDGTTPVALAHGYTRAGKLVRWKIKLLGRKVMWSVGDTQSNDPYGWEVAKKIGGSTLYITEGEEDKIAMEQVLKTIQKGTEYADLEYAIISLTDGVDSVNKSLAHVADFIKGHWQKVVICFDDDEPGRKGAKEAVRLLGQTAMIASLPANDANDCLKRGLLKQTREAVMWRGARPIPSALVNKADLILRMDEVLELGTSTPWQKMTDASFGQRRGEIWSLGGSEGGGKSTIARQMAFHNATEHDWGIVTAFMEESPQQTLRRMASLHDGLPYFDPKFKDDARYDHDKFMATCAKLLRNFEFWDRKQQGEDPYETWEGHKSMIRQVGHDADMYILDNLTILSEGLSASEKNDFLGKVYADQVKLAEDYQIMILDLSHLNPVAKGKLPHELGGKVLKGDFTGSRAASKYSHFMFGFERNMQAVDACCSILRGIKAREAGQLEAFKTYYDIESCKLIQRHWDDELFQTKELVEIKQSNKQHQ